MNEERENLTERERRKNLIETERKRKKQKERTNLIQRVRDRR